MAKGEEGFIYLDHAATTAVHPRVLEAMLPFFTQHFSNPSSMYRQAQECRQAIDRSRNAVAQVLGCRPAEIIFTSGGTESDNTAIRGMALALRDAGNHIITTAVEHHAVLHTCHALQKQGFETTYLPVDQYGMVRLEDLESAITPKTVLVSIMLANNEVGTIQPLAEAAALVKQKARSLGTTIVLHTDAVQGGAYLDLHVDRLGVDALSLSSHKFNGPKGVGVLYLRRATPFEPQQLGGSHERDRRAGTENVPGIVGTGAALTLAAEERESNVEQCLLLRDRLIAGISDGIAGSHLNGHAVSRLPNNVNFSFENTDSQWFLMALDEAGVAASSGSACNTASLEASHVLTAMGLPADLAIGTLRLTVGPENTVQEIDRVLGLLPETIRQVRASAPKAGNYL
ncbi:MAG: NifS2 [Dehalococcoidia bacterium]|nr:NifS2 [Dehalococcoidia bacterium]